MLQRGDVRFDNTGGPIAMSNPAIRAQQQTPMSVVQVQLILTICLPKLLPCNSRRNASSTAPHLVCATSQIPENRGYWRATHDELTHEPLANVRFAELSG
jgi:hypothetical protein